MRVWLPDRPGALGAIASRIGAVGGDVTGIEVMDRGAGQAIDEIVVQLPEGRLDLLVREVAEVDGAKVEETRRLADPERDTRFRALETAISVVEVADRSMLAQAVASAITTDLDAEWSAVVQGSRAILATAGPAPSPGWLTSFVEGCTATSADGSTSDHEDVAWALAPSAGLVFVVGRSGVAFRSRERRHLVGLSRLAAIRWAELQRADSPVAGPAAVSS